MNTGSPVARTQPAPLPVFRRAKEPLHRARTPSLPRRFRAEGERARGAFRRLWSDDLAVAAGRLARTCSARCVPTSHPFACCDVALLVGDWATASHYLCSARREPLGPPRARRGRCVLPTSATDSRHEHLTNVRLSRWAPRLRASHHVRRGKAPAHDSSETAFDDALPASDGSRTMSPLFGSPALRPVFWWDSSAAGSWWFLRSKDPPRDAPPPRRFQPQTRSASRPLTPHVAGSSSGRNPIRNQPRPLPPPPRQRTTAFPAQSAFHRRVLARFRFRGTSGASPPPNARTLPSRLGFRRSFAPRKTGGLDTAAFAGSSPASARRRAPLVDFCNQSVRKHDPRTDGTLLVDHPPCGECPRDPQPPCEGAGPRFHGPGTGVFWLLACRLPPKRLLASGALPQPDWLGHLLSRTRGLRDWSRHGTFRARLRVALSHGRGPVADFRRLRSEGRLAHPSAKKSAFRCTQGAFHLRTSSLEEGPFVPTLSPVCGLRALRLFNPRAFRTLWRERTDREDSTKCWIEAY